MAFRASFEPVRPASNRASLHFPYALDCIFDALLIPQGSYFIQETQVNRSVVVEDPRWTCSCCSEQWPGSPCSPVICVFATGCKQDNGNSVMAVWYPFEWMQTSSWSWSFIALVTLLFALAVRYVLTHQRD